VLEFPFAEAELAEKGSEDGFRMLAVPAGAEARIISEGWAARLKACPSTAPPIGRDVLRHFENWTVVSF